MYSKYVKIKFVVSFIIVWGAFSFQQSPEIKDTDTSAIIKAAYIYNFAKLIDWPSANKEGNFIIGVYGTTNVYKALINKYSAKRIGKQDIEIKKLSESPEVGSVHVLFIAQSNIQNLDAILYNLEYEPVLIITESDGAIDGGSVINFLIIKNSLKFELNISEAKNRQLIIGSRLKDLAYKIE
jgi:hypothetical protein